MLLRRLFGFPSNANFLKGTLIWRGLAISDDVSSTDDENDFFGITANDFYKSKSFQSSSPSNNDDFSKEVILTKHLSNDVRKNDLEKYICTKFGKIRFDWQNIPSKGGEIFSHKIKLKESNRNDSNTDYFEPTSREMSPSSSTVVNAHTVEIRNNNSEVNTEYITFINSQYFGNYRENINNDTQKQNPSFSDTDSVVLEQKSSHENFQHFDSKKISEIDLNDNFIESQYFHSFTNNSQVESDSNASKNSHKRLSDAAENINNFTGSYFPTNSFVNDNNHFANTESSQNKEDKECVSKYNFTQNRNNHQNAFEVSQKIRCEMKRENKGKFFLYYKKKGFFSVPFPSNFVSATIKIK